MSFPCSTRSSPNIIPQLDDPDRLMRRTDVHNESLYHAAYASKYILLQEAEIMDAWAQDLEDCNGHYVENVE